VPLAHLSASVQLRWFLIRFQLSDSDAIRFHRRLQAIDAIEMPSLQPLIDHIPNALSGYFCDGFVQGFLVSLGIADSLSLPLVLSLVLALGLGLDEHRQGEGVGMKFDKVRAGHGGGIEFGVPIVAL